MTLFAPFARLFENKRTAAAITVAILLSLALYIVPGVSLVPFHGDEATQIAMSRDAWSVLAGDFGALMYETRPSDPAAQELRLINGTLNPLLIGVTLALNGYSPDDLPRPWDWGAAYAYNVEVGARPDEALLITARLPSALLYALGLIPMYAIGYRVGGRPGALIAVFLYALHPALLVNGRRAMMEGGLIAFSLYTVWAGIWFVRASGRYGRGYIRAALLLGIAAGLALASKHTAVFVLVAVYSGVLAVSLARRRGSFEDDPMASTYSPRRGAALTALAGSGALALLIFFALNPAWWANPLSRAAEVLRLRSDLLAGQVGAFGGYAGLGEQLGGWMNQAFVPPAQYYEVESWATAIGAEIVRYEATFYDGLRDLQAAGLQDVLFDLLVPLMALAGLFVLLGRWRRADGLATPSQRIVIAAWVLVTIAFTALLTPLEWQRYYLPMHLATIVLVAVGTAWSMRPAKPARRVAKSNSGVPTSDS